MRGVFRLCIGLQMLLAAGAIGEQHSPYVAYQTREIKALSEQDIAGYLSGAGIGYALAAELNGYPGPKHVLELTQELQLLPEQVQHTQAVYQRMHAEAVRLGEQIVARERELEALFSHQQLTQDDLGQVLTELGRLQGDLRFVHLRAHLEMQTMLSPQQVQEYHRLRGYGAGDHHRHRHGHSHRPAAR